MPCSNAPARDVRWALVAFVFAGCGATTSGAHEPSERSEELFSEPEEYRAQPASAELGRRHFVEYGVGDPYGAGIPYPVYRAFMREMPDLLGRDFDELSERFGFVPCAEGRPCEDGLPVGFHLTRDPNTRVEFVMTNCQVCHAGRVRTSEGEQVIEGLGNRRVQIHAYANAFARMLGHRRFTPSRIARGADLEAESERLTWPSEYRSALVHATMRGIRARFGPRRAELARLADGLPGRVATIEGFSLALAWNGDAEIPFPEVIGWTRVPDIATARWRETNSFDAATIGSPVALAVGADFAFGVRPRWFDEHRHIGTSMYLYMKSFERRLPFPGEVDRELATRGFDAFETRCSGCHGHYARPGQRPRVSYTERVVPAEMVGTDTARLDAVSDAFVDASNALPITRGLTVTRRTNGWVPRPLVHVWARGQYGHNGQWPDLETIATPPDERPVRYIVSPDAPLNLERVGQAWRAADGELEDGEYHYDGTEPGFGVQGHPFLSDAPSEERDAILEYLKTL